MKKYSTVNVKGTLLLSGLLLFTASAWSQQYQRTDGGIKTTINAINIEIRYFNADIVRVLKSPVGVTSEKKSLSVIKTPVSTPLSIRQNGNILSLNSASLQTRINLQTGQISFSNAAAIALLEEKEAGLQFTPTKDGAESTWRVNQSFLLKEEEAIYGLGQHQKGLMNQRNQKLVLKQENMQIAVPFFQSVKGYGLFWDNYSTTVFNDTLNVASFESVIGNCADYYFINGGNADKVIAKMRWLTGEAPMYARWLYGFTQSRERYKSQYELMDVVKKYRALKVPLDGIVQDWQYWGVTDSEWNAMEFGNPSFPDPKAMIDSVHQANAHIIISIWPSFGNKTKIYQELKAQQMLYDLTTWPAVPEVQVYDAFNPKARDIYWKYLSKNILSIGMDGWWMDATEPDQIVPKPSDDENATYLGTFRKVRNAFPLVTTGGVYEHQRRVNTDKRVFILTRSAFAGQQRNAATNWSGDVVSGWDVFHKQISGGLNLSLSGIPYWNTDIGGFFSGRNYPKGVSDAAFQELYVRWSQFAAFTPMFRSHGTDTPREIYQFGEKGYWAYDAIVKFIHLRYRLLPYNYSNAWEVTSKSGTLMRALIMDFPADKKVWNINNEYLFGKNILVAPVTDSLYTSRMNGETVIDFSKIKNHKVYLPEGADWYDFWTGEKTKGGQEIEKAVPVDIIPLYVKAGTILPMGPFQQYTGEKDASNLELRVYEGANGTFTLYEDENDNYNYERKIYSTITMKWNDKAKTLIIEDRKGSYPGMLSDRSFNIILVKKGRGNGVEVVEKADRVIQYSGKKVELHF